MKAGRFATAAALVVVAIGIAVPAALASSPDAVARYVTSHRAQVDVIGRWLTVHEAGSLVQPGPVSDLDSSLMVERRAAGAGSAPVSDVASSLQVERRAFVSQPSPVSDVASSLEAARDAAAVGLASTKSATGFAWQDAGIGAGAAVLLVAFGMSSLFYVRRHRQLAA